MVVSGKYIFNLRSEDKRRALPHKIVIGQRENESPAHVLLKLLAYLLFFRERLLIEPRVDNESIPFVPDLLQIDYALRPTLWVECGDCGVVKLDKLAVKVPEAEIWVVKRSWTEADHLRQAMLKAELRKDRYNLIGLDAAFFDEVAGLLQTRNEVFWVAGLFDPPTIQLDFNGLWFDTAFDWMKV